tara:strand:+ start:131 stop:2401 length:2271 start_codon:yes stop_codon:yes gene_type:complete
MMGAGGTGMAPLALFLRGAGHDVTACDDAFTQPVREMLLSGGVKLAELPDPGKGFDEIVHSSAIKSNHPVMISARQSEIPIFRRGQALAQSVTDKKLVAVVGSHGKTTTTAMLVHLLGYADVAFGYVVGGFFDEAGVPSARWAADQWVIAEVDESDGTIECFEPEITVVLNCDLDHVDRYEDLEDMKAAYGRLFARTKGQVFVPYGHELQNLANEEASCEVSTFGPGGCFDAEVKETDRGLHVIRNTENGKVEESVRALGDFNGWNAVAALVVCEKIAGQAPLDRLGSFPGLKRRQVVLCDSAERMIMEDYAHHPVELTAILRHFRNVSPQRHLRVVFQPHRFSRQTSLRESFAEALSVADDLYLLPTYGAGETPSDSGRSDTLIGLLPDSLSQTRVYQGFYELSDALEKNSDDQDCVLFLGAGDIEKYASAFVHFEATGRDRWLACGRYLRQRLSPETAFRFNEPLASKTTLRVGGKARLYCEPSSPDDLRELIMAARLFELPIFALGRGSNLIVPTEGYEGIVICMRSSSWRSIETMSDNRLIVGSGARLKEICLMACSQGLSGFEFLEGIPGTLGGALRMNAGAMGGDIFDLVESVTIMNKEGVRREMNRKEFHTAYRECPELKDAFVINATMRAPATSTDSLILDQLRGFAKTRQHTQPYQASAGCIFRNPMGESAGRLIDEEGLKGIRVGEAEVSRKHGNFIINRGGATAEDVLSLISLVRRKVEASRGIVLEPEVTLMGKSWEETFKKNL